MASECAASLGVAVDQAADSVAETDGFADSCRRKSSVMAEADAAADSDRKSSRRSSGRSSLMRQTVSSARRSSVMLQTDKLTCMQLGEMRFIQVKAIVALASLLYLGAYGASVGYWGIAVLYATACLANFLVRTLTDWAFDLAHAPPEMKTKRVLALGLLNAVQLRSVYEAQLCLRSGKVGMGLRMTLICEALSKVVPLTWVDAWTLLRLLLEPESDAARLVAIVYLAASVCTKSYFVGSTVLSFELMTNPVGSAPVKNRLRLFFAADVLSRCISLGALTCAITTSRDLPHALALSPYLLSYATRALLLSALYVSRGFIYPPSPPAVDDGTGTCQKVIFACFPAAFVQQFTSLPFNGDLASSRPFFLAHQGLSSLECLAYFLLAALVPRLELLRALGPGPGFALLATWALAWLANLLLFPIYLSARSASEEAAAAQASSHLQSMEGSQSGDSARRIKAVERELAAARAQVQFLVVVKKGSPECDDAARALQQRDALFRLVDLDEHGPAEKTDMMKYLGTFCAGCSPVLPLVWCGQECVGGLQELLALLRVGPSSLEGVVFQESADGKEFAL
mmetsp:Transcript_98192/g.305706  ORF Transcript_98192/g.305706 Transcript_98192/m.305706 type:complete len:571 (+) Transcript_98192:85-1797(+)